MIGLELSTSFLFFLLPLTFFFLFKSFLATLLVKYPGKLAPRSYPLIGSLFPILQNSHRLIQWTSDIVNNSPTKTFILHRPLGRVRVITGNPDVVFGVTTLADLKCAAAPFSLRYMLMFITLL
ncbi:hypothetical protein L2E82_13059 [Cichorium intybus]|uniref:Uncharacterized protein n=1 Tax=Cichorium intybus TaxID=13427 RepID=A0ACB9GII7_CICIN|nr:hypothetical protein L2E82_13059 [Cichorium intybus]